MDAICSFLAAILVTMLIVACFILVLIAVDQFRDTFGKRRRY